MENFSSNMHQHGGVTDHIEKHEHLQGRDNNIRRFAADVLEKRHHLRLAYGSMFETRTGWFASSNRIHVDIQRRVTKTVIPCEQIYICVINIDLAHLFQVNERAFFRKLSQCCSQAFHRHESTDIGVVFNKFHMNTACSAKKFYHFGML